MRQTIEYAILGTSHAVWDSPEFEVAVTKAIRKHSITFIAEEYPCDTLSRVCAVAKRLHIAYLQIDLFPEEWDGREIAREMRARTDAACLRDEDVRLSHADAAREQFWLERIERSIERGRVLVVCGYLHVDFLAREVLERGGDVAERSTFPPDLLRRRPTKIFGPDELEKFLRERGEGAGP